jgi:hypothetical protein
MGDILRLFDSQTREITIATNETWRGFLLGSTPLAQIFLEIFAKGNSQVDLWSMKSCYPQPETDIYDIQILSIGSDSQTAELTTDCNFVDGGVWFFTVRCNPSNPTNSCSFSITLKGL